MEMDKDKDVKDKNIFWLLSLKAAIMMRQIEDAELSVERKDKSRMSKYG